MTNETAEQLTPEDEAAIIASLTEGDTPTLSHTVLEIWSEILSNLETEEKSRTSPVVATRIVRSWPGMQYRDIPRYWELYYTLMREMRDALMAVIRSDEDCFSHVEDDAEENRDLYLEVLFQWSDIVGQWEENWDLQSEDAVAHVAAIADCGAFFIGEQGLAAHLSQEQVGFRYTEEDRVALTQRLTEAADARAEA